MKCGVSSNLRFTCLWTVSLVTRRQKLVAPGPRALLEHSLATGIFIKLQPKDDDANVSFKNQKVIQTESLLVVQNHSQCMCVLTYIIMAFLFWKSWFILSWFFCKKILQVCPTKLLQFVGILIPCHIPCSVEKFPLFNMYNLNAQNYFWNAYCDQSDARWHHKP